MATKEEILDTLTTEEVISTLTTLFPTNCRRYFIDKILMKKKEEILHCLSNKQLQTILRNKGLKVSGKSDEVISRILNGGQEPKLKK